jgi:hypothetical protein
MAELVHAGDGESERHCVASRAHADRRQDDDGQKLDRGDRAERQPGDRLVEAAVHRREDRAPADQQPPSRAVQPAERAPRLAPQREHHRRRRDPQPCHAEHRHPREQQHGERRAEVVKDGARHEVQLRRDLPVLHRWWLMMLGKGVPVHA